MKYYQKKEVRKAINYAIDKSNIIMSIYNNKYYVSDSPIDYGSYLYETENVSLGYNPEQSKKYYLMLVGHIKIINGKKN